MFVSHEFSSDPCLLKQSSYIWVESDLSFSELISNNGTLRGELQSATGEL